MSDLVFNFCATSRVLEEIPPNEPSAMSMNGWDFTFKPKIPYRPEYKIKLSGLRWYLNAGETALDLTTDVTHNAGKLREFYLAHRLWDSFLITHQFLGEKRVRFSKPVVIPSALTASGGLIPEFEVMVIEESPGY